MVAKLISLILTLGLVGVLMLNLRQERLQVMHEMADLQKRLAEHDRDFLKMRSQIASRVAPPVVLELAAKLGPTVPIATLPAPDDRSPTVAAATNAAGPKPGQPSSRQGQSVLVGLPAKPPAPAPH
ncbi:MAG: hypothetical protein ACKVS8_06485 [Phycisphaerales bacterium]